MRRINEAQDGAAHAELNMVAVVEWRRAGDALLVNQRPVEAAVIYQHVLPVAALNFSVATRDHSRRSFNRHFHFGIAPQSRHILRQLYAFELTG